MAEHWPAEPRDEPRTRRLATAFVLSSLCHALVLVVAPGWRVESRPMPPLVVTMLAPGSAAGGAAGLAPAAEAAPAPPPASVAPVPVPAPIARRAERVRPPTRPVPRARPVPDDRPAPMVAAVPAAGPATATGASVEPSSVARGGDGGIGGGRGGARSGDGSGSDGLRGFCTSCPAPDYPSRARRQGWQGTVDVALAIARDGAVREARVALSSGYPALDEVALDVARRSRFAIPDGGDGMRGQLRYRFVLDATAARQ